MVDSPVIGILRGVDQVFFGELMHASFGAGLTAIEVTMNTKDACGIVDRYRQEVPDGAYLGMGTIRNLDEAKRAADAGAMFFVTPNLDREVISFAVKKEIPVIAGALTPTEIYTAWAEGATMIKVFPCRTFGPAYFRDIAGPFEDIPLAAVGGVTNENVAAYFEAGAKAVGVSTALFGKAALKDKQCDRIAENVASFVALCSRCRNSS